MRVSNQGDGQCDVVVLYETYVQSMVSPELDVGTCAEVRQDMA